MKRFDEYWYSRNLIALLLLPLSWLYCSLVIFRRALYKTGLLKTVRLPVPVVIVGNIVVGGTGKTPLLIALCQLLVKKGYKPGIVSRGYKGALKGEKLVSLDDRAELVGDEPLLIARHTRCPVAVGRNRTAAARLLLAHHHCDVILSDDGLQHYQLDRDYEIAVVDSVRGHGNGFCLPAGPLREKAHRLKSVNLVVYNGAESSDHHNDIFFYLSSDQLVSLVGHQTRSFSEFKDRTVHAVAGIGHPQRFFNLLRKKGFSIEEHAFPDHHGFTEADLSFGNDRDIIMTEKDAVKCSNYQKQNAWFLPVKAELSPKLVNKFVTELGRIIHG